MSKSQILKIAGVAAVAVGSALLYIGGSSASQVTAIVGAVFALAAVIAVIFQEKVLKAEAGVEKLAADVAAKASAVVDAVKK